MVASWLVIVGNDDYIPTSQMFAVLVPPLSSAARVRGRNQIKIPEAITILLALHDEHSLAGVRRDQFWQAVKHSASTIKGVLVSACAVRLSLIKTFRIGSYGFVKY